MIKAPNWAKKAHPTKVGWVYKGELLICRRFTEAEIAEWEKSNAKPSVKATPTVSPKKKSITSTAPRKKNTAKKNNSTKSAPKKRNTTKKNKAPKTVIYNHERNDKPSFFYNLFVNLKKVFTRK